MNRSFAILSGATALLTQNSTADKLYDLTAKNSNAKPDLAHKPPAELIKEIEGKERKIQEILVKIKNNLDD